MDERPYADMINVDALYPLGERPTVEIQRLGNTLRARWTGEKRLPRKGEWFLSGAIIEAYQAKCDMTTPFHIARLVRARQVWTEV